MKKANDLHIFICYYEHEKIFKLINTECLGVLRDWRMERKGTSFLFVHHFNV